MKIQCEYCGGWLQDTDATCPNCGGTNNHLKRFSLSTPQTIEELKLWYQERNLPPSEVTRFFIGENYRGARAFGIYKDPDTGDFVVYKNKDDGSRAVRYEGPDEAYAVNELLDKLKSEILNQKNHSMNRSTVSHPVQRSNGMDTPKIVAVVVACMVMTISFQVIPILGIIILGYFITLFVPKRRSPFSEKIREQIPFLRNADHESPSWRKGKRIATIVAIILIVCIFALVSGPKYYYYNGNVYCKYHGDYYEYFNDDYIPIGFYDLPANLLSSPSSYKLSPSNSNWNSSYSFFSSDYYDTSSSSSYSSGSYSSGSSSWNSDWDSGYDWDSYDSWDSGGTDWGSDW